MFRKKLLNDSQQHFPLKGYSRAVLKKINTGIIPFTLLFSSATTAASFSADSILISKSNSIYEYTQAGQLLQAMPVENRFGVVPAISDSYGRDLVVGAEGDIHVFNMTDSSSIDRTASISTYNVNTNDWSHRAEGETLKAGGAGIAYNDGTVFAADPQDGSSGIHAFGKSTFEIFATGLEVNDVNMGLDGFLYALSINPVSATVITKYDPFTYDYLGSLQVDNDSKAFAVDEQGDIFLANWGGSINQLTFDGTLVNSASFALGTEEILPGIYLDDYCRFTDMDISDSGALLLGCYEGEVMLTDTSLNSYSFFDTGSQGVYVAFSDESLTAVPLPAAFWLFGSGLVGLFCIGKRK